jgi:type I restriction enzyme S subunit
VQDTHIVTTEAEHLLPEGWRIVKLGQLGTVSGGSTPSTKVSEYWDGDIAWATPSDVTKCTGIYISDTVRKITKAGLENSATKLLPSGAVLMTSRATIGEVVINRIPMATNQGFINVVCDPRVAHNEYLAFWIRQNKRVFEERAHGVTYREISKSNFKEIPITLPPLPEQRAIAHTLRTVQAAREARRREAALERERKAALMQRLFTQGTRGEPTKTTEIGEVPVSWEVKRLEKAVKRTQYGLSLAGKAIGSVPILRMNSLSDGGIATDDLQYVDLDQATLEQFKLNKGDLLFNRTNSYELVGKTGLFELDATFVFASYLIRVTLLLDKAEPAFFNAYLNWTPTQRRLKAMASRGVSQSNINATKLASLLVPLPSLTEQRTIAEILRACDEKIAALEREAAVHNELFKALLEELMTAKRRIAGV